MREIIEYLAKYDQPFVEVEDTEESRAAIRTLLKWLKNYPDIYCRTRGPFFSNEYCYEEYDLFYIRDMVTFKMLLDDKRYFSFIHEVYDFLFYKLCRENIEDDTVILPQNIKAALITTITGSFPLL